MSQVDELRAILNATQGSMPWATQSNEAWRQTVRQAEWEGDKAELLISTRDLAELLKLSQQQRQDIMDRRLEDARIENLLPHDLKALRESIVGRDSTDQSGFRLDRLKRQIASVEIYQKAYMQQILSVRRGLDFTNIRALMEAVMDDENLFRIARHYVAGRKELKDLKDDIQAMRRGGA